jgi:hypothetical protein
MTIPKGCLFPCCGMNLAFDRLAVGPCMYFGIMYFCFDFEPTNLLCYVQVAM